MVKYMEYVQYFAERNGQKMKTEKISIRGIMYDNITLSESEKIIEEILDAPEAKFHAVYTPNSEIAQMCIDDQNFMDIINAAELVIPDGIGVIKASQILGTPLKEKVAGIDFGTCALKKAAEKSAKVYFLGGKPGVAELAAKNMSEKIPGLTFCGTKDGYFKKSGEENDAAIADINSCSPDILFVCLGAPLQEKWISENREKLKGVRLCLGLGGSLDVFAGNVKRAPKIFIKLGLEWLYRLIKEPKRIGRMLNIPKFLFATYKYKKKNKNK